MRNVLVGIVCLLAAANLFGGSCSDPYILISGIQGELPAPCQGAVEFMNVNVSLSSVTIVKTIDKASPQLMLACATGKHIPEATLRASAAETLKFKDVIVTAWSQSRNDNGVTENVTFNFTKIEYQYQNHTTSGGSKSYVGAARPITAKVFVASSGGGVPEEATHFETTVRAGGASTTSVQFAMKPVAVRAGITPQPQPPVASNGFIELRSLSGGVLARYQYTGATRSATGNLRIERLLVAPR